MSIMGSACIAQALDTKRTEQGATLSVLSLMSPVLVVFLRHPGCTFCRESLGDIAASRPDIEAKGVRIVLVHHGDSGAFKALLIQHGLSGIDHIHDDDLSLYRAFGLGRGTIRQLAGLRVWLRGARAAILGGHGVGKVLGDALQMPGVFLLHKCRLVGSFRHRHAGDRPDYRAMATGRTIS
jgi:peroxiredoxin